MSSREPVNVSCQDSWQPIEETVQQDELNKRISNNLGLIRDDIQRMATSINLKPQTTYASGNHRLVCPVAGIAEIIAITDTSTSLSTGVNYNTIGVTRNGLAIFSFVTASGAEFSSFGSGKRLGKIAVAKGDVLALTVALSGAPSISLLLGNLMLLINLQDN
jgi:hypothetical protein